MPTNLLEFEQGATQAALQCGRKTHQCVLTLMHLVHTYSQASSGGGYSGV